MKLVDLILEIKNTGKPFIIKRFQGNEEEDEMEFMNIGAEAEYETLYPKQFMGHLWDKTSEGFERYFGNAEQTKEVFDELIKYLEDNKIKYKINDYNKYNSNVMSIDVIVPKEYFEII